MDVGENYLVTYLKDGVEKTEELNVQGQIFGMFGNQSEYYVLPKNGKEFTIKSEDIKLTKLV